MSLFKFIKDAGAKIFGGSAAAANRNGRIDAIGIPSNRFEVGVVLTRNHEATQ